MYYTGTTWVQEIAWLIHKNLDLTEALTTPLDSRMKYLEVPRMSDSTPNIDLLHRENEPKLIKTHLPARYFQEQLDTDDVKVIIPLRNPKDTLVSFFHFYRMHTGLKFSGSWDDFFELYREKRLLYGDLFDWYEDWWAHRRSSKVLPVKYEDMKHNLKKEIRRIAEFMGRDFTDDQLETIRSRCTFQAMASNSMTNFTWMDGKNQDHKISKFMRKGAVGDWSNYFSEEQSKILDDQYNSRLVGIGLEFDFYPTNDAPK